MIKFLDVVNCENDDGCHDNASCTDDNGSYTCVCKDGFTGDGFNCTGNKLKCFYPSTESQEGVNMWCLIKSFFEDRKTNKFREYVKSCNNIVTLVIEIGNPVEWWKRNFYLYFNPSTR